LNDSHRRHGDLSCHSSGVPEDWRAVLEGAAGLSSAGSRPGNTVRVYPGHASCGGRCQPRPRRWPMTRVLAALTFVGVFWRTNNRVRAASPQPLRRLPLRERGRS
jgi:hypothetical protein